MYFFYKNIVFTIPQIYFAFISNFSAETVFDDWYISFYNMFFTAVPIIFRSVFETDVDYRPQRNEKRDQLLELTPRLYYLGRRGLIFTYLNYFYWICCAVVHSLLIFLITYYVFGYTIMDRYGRNTDMWGYSMWMFFSVMIIITIKIMATGRLFNIFNFIAIFLLSLALYYGYSWVSNYLNFSKTLLTSEQLHESPIFYLTIFLCCGTVLIFELLIETVRVNLMGGPAEYARKEINWNKIIPYYFDKEFTRLLKIKELGFVHQDIRKEKWIVKRRERRMKKLEDKLRKEEEEKAKKLASKPPKLEKNNSEAREKDSHNNSKSGKSKYEEKEHYSKEEEEGEEGEESEEEDSS